MFMYVWGIRTLVTGKSRRSGGDVEADVVRRLTAPPLLGGRLAGPAGLGPNTLDRAFLAHALDLLLDALLLLQLEG
jgi:hypothetical protein